MILSEGMHCVPAGHIATVVTYLQMTAPAVTTPKPLPAGMTLEQETLDLESYRALFRAVGAPWLWTSRLVMKDDTLRAILGSADTELWIMRQDGDLIAFIELDFSLAIACELTFFGMITTATGQGLGGSMIALAQSRAFARDISAFSVHTCSLDDPRALEFYINAGFVPYKREIEVFADPRLQGVHPKSTAPQIPCLT
jgi:ribosomal protein S18 acetylase RimI-like enzyme